MKNHIILLASIFIILIIYFTYKKNTYEHLIEANINTDYILNFLQNKNMSVSDEGILYLNTSTNQKIPIDFSNDKININNQYTFDPSNNIFQCGAYNIDNTGLLKDINNKLTIDQNDKRTIGNFEYDENKGMSINDNSINVDFSGNINFADYMYSSNGTIKRNDNRLNIDLEGNIITENYKINPKNKTFEDKEQKILLNGLDSLKCGNYEYNTDFGNKLTVGNTDYYVNNNKITDLNNLFSYEPNNTIKMNNNKYVYNINNNNLYGNLTDSDNFNIVNDIITINGTTSSFENYDGKGKTIYGVTKILLEKPKGNNSTAYSFSYYNPFRISSIRFYDYKGDVITPDKYTVKTTNIVDGRYNPASTKTINKYFDVYNSVIQPTIDSTGKSINYGGSYGGPKIDSYSLFWNKTNKLLYDINNNFIGYQIAPTTEQPYLNQSHQFIGHGLAGGFSNGIRPETITPEINPSVVQSYLFTFDKPYFIKYVELEPAKKVVSEYGICNAYLQPYLRINDEDYPLTNVPIGMAGVNTGNGTAPPLPMTDGLSPVDKIPQQPKNKIEKYTSVNYNNTPIPTGMTPIMRYYIQ
jgi:hypothetical protein